MLLYDELASQDFRNNSPKPSIETEAGFNPFVSVCREHGRHASKWMTSYNQFVDVESNIGTKLKSLPNHIGLIEYIVNELLHLHKPDFLSRYPRLVIVRVDTTRPVPFLSVL